MEVTALKVSHTVYPDRPIYKYNRWAKRIKRLLTIQDKGGKNEVFKTNNTSD